MRWTHKERLGCVHWVIWFFLLPISLLGSALTEPPWGVTPMEQPSAGHLALLTLSGVLLLLSIGATVWAEWQEGLQKWGLRGNLVRSVWICGVGACCIIVLVIGTNVGSQSVHYTYTRYVLPHDPNPFQRNPFPGLPASPSEIVLRSSYNDAGIGTMIGGMVGFAVGVLLWWLAGPVQYPSPLQTTVRRWFVVRAGRVIRRLWLMA